MGVTRNLRRMFVPRGTGVEIVKRPRIFQVAIRFTTPPNLRRARARNSSSEYFLHVCQQRHVRFERHRCVVQSPWCTTDVVHHGY